MDASHALVSDTVLTFLTKVTTKRRKFVGDSQFEGIRLSHDYTLNNPDRTQIDMAKK